MRNAFALTLIVAAVPQAETAHVVRHNSVPDAYWGTWAPGECSASDKAAIVLAAKTRRSLRQLRR